MATNIDMAQVYKGVNIKRLRIKAGLSQSQLSLLSGVSQTTISKLEFNPNRIPRLDVIVNIADSLGVRVEDMIIT